MSSYRLRMSLSSILDRCTFTIAKRLQNLSDSYGGHIAKFVHPSTCVFTYIIIDNRFYKRDTNIHDDPETTDDLVKSGSFADNEIVQGMVTSGLCHDSSVPYGNVHHVGCDMERCPICHDQFISCGHNLEVRYYKGLQDNRGRFKRGMMHPLMKGKMEARFECLDSRPTTFPFR